MFLSRVTIINPMAASARRLIRDDYEMHREMYRIMLSPDDKQRDFLYRATGSKTPQALILSEDAPRDRHGLWSVESKPYEIDANVGDVFDFDIRLNPTVAKSGRSRHGGQSSRSQKVDVVEVELREARETSESISRDAIVQRAVSRWLGERPRLGFEVVDLIASQHTVRKLQGARTIATVDVTGSLRVVDVESFKQSALGGVGRGRAFGCGLLLLKRL